MSEPPGWAIDQGHDFMPARHSEGTARTEVVLDVDHNQDIAVADPDAARHQRFRS
jgi:hypothetical protein